MAYSLRIVPLGGLGHIGGNMMALETQDDLIVIDGGILFGDDYTPGVDYLVPDIGYVISRKEKFRGYVITHGHEDHIGALPFLLKRLEGPIYAGPFASDLIRHKMKERYDAHYTLHEYDDYDTFQVGDFGIEALPTTHSIPGACSLVFDTPIGKVIHTGDFKIDREPVDGRNIAEARFKELGDKGITLLLSDSTNSTKEGWTRSENDVVLPIEKIVKETYGRCYITLFSSNLFRVQSAFLAAKNTGRKILVAGRGLENNIRIAQESRRLELPQDIMVSAKEAKKLRKNELLILISGSQGEPRSALTRIARGEHRDLDIEAGDRIIFSSRKIPGNEKSVGRLQNDLARLGAEIIDDRMFPVHTSGHAFRDEQRTLISWIRPEWFIPIHGEYRHLIDHAKSAKGEGVSASQVAILEDGHAAEFIAQDEELELEIKVDESAAGLNYVIGKTWGDVGETLLRDRRKMSENGLVIGCVVMNKDGSIAQRPNFIFKGSIDPERYAHKLEEMIEFARDALSGLSPTADKDTQIETLRLAMRRFLKNQFKIRPELVSIVTHTGK